MEIKIIGTTHLMSKEEIIKIIKEEKPDIIGVELCQTRLNLMVMNPITNQLATGQLESAGLIQKISQTIKEKAEKENIQYGSDMINASKYAIENNIQLELLDRDIMEIQTLMEKIPKEELNYFMQELTKFQEQNLSDSKNIDENKVINELNLKAPISSEILLNSRELYITNKILKLILKYPKKRILIFLGKGHLNSIKKELDLK